LLILFRHLEMYLDCVMTKENVALLFHIATKIKSLREPNSEKMTFEEREKMVKENRLDDDPNAVSVVLSVVGFVLQYRFAAVFRTRLLSLSAPPSPPL
jgi:hypothetical protein